MTATPSVVVVVVGGVGVVVVWVGVEGRRGLILLHAWSDPTRSVDLTGAKAFSPRE